MAKSSLDSAVTLRAPGRRADPAQVTLPDYLPARMLNEFVYCPRLFFYEWVEGVFKHSSDTVEGALRHEKLERKEDALPPAEEASDETIHSRSVELSSDTHQLIARIDLVEGAAGAVVAVDYKKGRPRDGDAGPEAWPADRVQVCAQALVLRDNGYACDEAVLYYSATKQRVRLAIDAALLAETLQALDAARALASRGRIPAPLIDSPKCPRCSLVTICLPDETALSMRLPAEVDQSAQLSLFEPPQEDVQEDGALPTADDEPLRRLVPARDDLRPLYVNGHGLAIGKSGEVLQVKEYGKGKGAKTSRVVQEARIGEVSQVNVFGNVQLSAAAVQGLCWSEKPVAHFSFGGWFYGLTQGLGLKNVFLRREQFRRADDAQGAKGT